MKRTALAIRHLAFEDLGSFAGVLEERGFNTIYVEACVEGALEHTDAESPDLLFILGGPLGVYDKDAYPLLKQELALVERRLRCGRPLLGICLGAQLVAHALGARVYPGPAKEIGWGRLSLTQEGRASSLAWLTEDRPVFHWHGDTFDLPHSATLLASTGLVENQAFSMDKNVLGVQFHPEFQGYRVEPWLVGHACELAQADVDVTRLRKESGFHALDAQKRGRAFFGNWLDEEGLAALHRTDLQERI